MLVWIVTIAAGLVLLVWGADRFVFGASATARNLGVSPMVVGLTVVGVGTSAPEMLISTMAALNATPGIAIGNAVGSNIANVGLVIAVSALVIPISVSSPTLKREFPLMFAAIMLAWLLLSDGQVDRMDGVILLVAFAVTLGLIGYTGVKTASSDPMAGEFAERIPGSLSTLAAVLWTVAGLVVLLVSSRMVVTGAAGIARAMEVSDLVIGLTIVAVGTSLPELAASVVSVLKNEPDLALGNVLGSNMFNMLPVLGLPGLIAGAAVEPEALSRDFPVMAVFCVALFLMAFGFKGPGRINRVEGAVLLLCFFAYQLMIAGVGGS